MTRRHNSVSCVKDYYEQRTVVCVRAYIGTVVIRGYLFMCVILFFRFIHHLKICYLVFQC